MRSPGMMLSGKASRMKVPGWLGLARVVERIVNHVQSALRVEGVAEVAGLPRGQRHGGQEVVGTALAQAFVVHEEEGAVALDAAAQRAAEQVVLELAFGNAGPVVRPRVGVQDLALQESVGDAMKLVGAGFRGYVDHAAAGASELGRVSCGLNLELGHRFERVGVGRAVGGEAASIAAIHQNGILLRQAAGDAGIARIADGGIAGGSSGRASESRRARAPTTDAGRGPGAEVR